MMGYVGQCRGAKMLATCRAAGLGEATQRGEFPPARLPYFLDNGAFADWTNHRPFAESSFLRDVEQIASEGPAPDFIVAPDRVADPSSLEWSLSWVPRLRGAGPLAFVVQDGMQDDDVRRALKVGGFAVLFVGGSLSWKLESLPRWVALGHAEGVRVHCGRMGTAPRVKYARLCGADSVDSCTPLWSEANMRRFIKALGGPLQLPIGAPHPPPARAVAWTKASDRRKRFA